MRRKVLVTCRGRIRIRPVETSPATQPKTTSTAPKRDSERVRRREAPAPFRTAAPRGKARKAQMAMAATRRRTTPEERRWVNSTKVEKWAASGTTAP
jgi:hypothetical protein